jgi:hypothetical protein
LEQKAGIISLKAWKRDRSMEAWILEGKLIHFPTEHGAVRATYMNGER